MAVSTSLLLPKTASVETSTRATPTVITASQASGEGESGAFQAAMTEALGAEAQADAVMPGLPTPIMVQADGGITLPLAGNAMPAIVHSSAAMQASAAPTAASAFIAGSAGLPVSRKSLDAAIAAVANGVADGSNAEGDDQLVQRLAQATDTNPRVAFQSLLGARAESSPLAPTSGDSRGAIAALFNAMQGSSGESSSREHGGSIAQISTAWSLSPGATTAPRAPTLALNLPLTMHDPAWGEEMAQRVTWMVRQEMPGAEIRINPPHLGPIEVRVSVAQDQVNVAFSAPHALTREALDAAMPRLRELLLDQGLNLAQADVGQQSLAEQQTGAEPQSDDNPAMSAGAVAADEITAQEGEAGMSTTALTQGLVDYYA